MAPRRTILKELVQARERNGGQEFLRPEAISGFGSRPEKYQLAVNQLLKDRLIEGRKDDDGRMTLAVNDHRLAEARRAARPLWARPAVWAAAVIVITVVSLGFVV
jgi:hypothetical protein